MQYSNKQSHGRQKGLGILEVLIAVVVLAIGIVALASFQGGLLRSGSDSKARTIATNFAQERMEILRAFEDADEWANTLLVNGNDAPQTQGGTIFNTAWVVEDFIFPLPAGSPARLTVAGETADYKRITVTVAWNDESGVQQRVQLESNVNSSSPSAGGRTLVDRDDNKNTPLVGYTPGAAPLIIAHDDANVGGGQASSIQESTTPEPEVISASGTTSVSFDEVTYDTVDPSNPIVLNRDSFLTVNCVCQFGRADTELGLAPTTFDFDIDDDGDDAFADNEWVVGGAVADKTVGEALTGNVSIGGDSFNFSKQPPLCDICCRDHHDGGVGNNNFYDPFRHNEDTSGTTGMFSSAGNDHGDHQHYFPDAGGTLVLATDKGQRDKYIEACRFVRADGLWRVLADWRLETMQVMTNQFLSSPSNVALYQDFVKAYIIDYVDWVVTDSQLATPQYPTVTPNPLSNPSSASSVALQALLNDHGRAADGITTDALAMNPNTSLQLMARGLYLDYMDPDLLRRIDCMTTVGGCPSDDPPIDEDDNYLAVVPFHEVNITELVNWATSSGAVDESTGLSEPIPAGDNPVYNRGLVNAVSEDTDVLITATAELSNTGLTDTRVIDPDLDIDADPLTADPAADATTIADGLDIDIGTGDITPGHTVSGTVDIGNNIQLSINDIEIISDTPDAFCFVTAATSSYQCELPELDSNGSPVTDIVITVKSYNYSAVVNNCASPVVYDNQVNHLNNASTITPDSTIVFGDGTAAENIDEYTEFTVTGLTQDETLSFKITKDGGNGACI